MSLIDRRRIRYGALGVAALVILAATLLNLWLTSRANREDAVDANERADHLYATAEQLCDEVRARGGTCAVDVKPEDGKDGKDGRDGKDGEDGRDVTLVCDQQGRLVASYSDGTSARIGTCTGVPGKDGQDGVAGKDGVDGVDGTNGTDGKDGADGRGVTLVCEPEDDLTWALMAYYTDGTSSEVGSCIPPD